MSQLIHHPLEGTENGTLTPQYLLWEMMENFSLVEKNSDNTMETVGIIFTKKIKLTHSTLQTLKRPLALSPIPLQRAEGMTAARKKSLPLDPSVTLSLMGPARRSCPPGWNVTKINCNLVHSLASLVAQLVKNLPAMRETWVRSLGWEDSLEKEKGYPLKYPDLEKSMDCIVHGVTKSQTWLSSLHYSPQYCDLDNVFTERRSLPGFY